jgi:hypothetical protein
MKSLLARGPAVRHLMRLGQVALVLGCLAVAAPATGDDRPAPIRIAVFAFELEDDSPAAMLMNQRDTRADIIGQVTSEAGQELARTGRYSIVDGSTAAAKAVQDKTLRDCEGCEAQLALQLGAQQSLIGVVKRVTQTDYYVFVRVRDARSGKILDQEEANFAGDETGWPTGARMLIKHQLLPGLEALPTKP